MKLISKETFLSIKFLSSDLESIYDELPDLDIDAVEDICNALMADIDDPFGRTFVNDDTLCVSTRKVLAQLNEIKEQS